MRFSFSTLLLFFLTFLTGPVDAQVRSYPGQSRAAAVIIHSGTGAPSGTFGKGTFALDASGDIFICNTSPCTAGGHWVQVNGSSGAVSATTFDAHTILAATTDNTPAALTVAEQRVVGRVTAGNIAALTGAQFGGMVALGDLSDVDATGPTAADLLTWDGDSWAPTAPAIPLPGPMLFSFHGDDSGTYRSTTSTVTVGNIPWRPSTYDAKWTHVRFVALLSATAAGAEPVNINLIRTQLFGGSEGSGTELAIISQSSIAGGSGAWSVVTVLVARSSLSSSNRHYSISLNRGGGTGSALCLSIIAYLTTSAG